LEETREFLDVAGVWLVIKAKFKFESGEIMGFLKEVCEDIEGFLKLLSR